MVFYYFFHLLRPLLSLCLYNTLFLLLRQVEKNVVISAQNVVISAQNVVIDAQNVVIDAQNVVIKKNRWLNFNVKSLFFSL